MKESNDKPTYRFSWDIVWILTTVLLYILVNGASGWARSFFTASYLQ